ncbi:MAG: ROK family protein [Burkholderiales bacterium]|nr:ROK family protein [Burkholderiales bacterium]
MDRGRRRGRPAAAACGWGDALKVLAIDVGGSHVKCLVSGKSAARVFVSGPAMTAAGMVEGVLAITRGWSYEAVSIGYPGPVMHGSPVREPRNLGKGWLGFDFAGAFARPVKLVNDAAMQALGSYQGGRMLFLGLGTGLGSALIVGGEIEAMELAHLPYKKGRSYEDCVGARGLARLGKKKWRKAVLDVIDSLNSALRPDYVVLGGGNARKLQNLPGYVRRGDNANAFLGGFRLWNDRPAAKAGRP